MPREAQKAVSGEENLFRRALIVVEAVTFNHGGTMVKEVRKYFLCVHRASVVQTQTPDSPLVSQEKKTFSAVPRSIQALSEALRKSRRSRISAMESW